MPSLRETLLNPDEEIVTGVPWETFRRYLAHNWTPGQHKALIGPTGEGKSTYAVGILGMRRYVIALDPKGGDDTLAASGFQRIPHWPPPGRVRQDIAEGRGARLILGERGADFETLAEEFGKALDGVLKEGGWTVYIDEFQVASDRRMMNVGIKAE